ncbi:MAG: hypothetical protein JNM17_10000 [Archangium sp.]|nr:hypothetical protein [Archangium sp.]
MRPFLLFCLVSGCSTVTPMQTASVVAPNALRVGGQLGTAGFCGNPGDGAGGIFSCTDYPDGVPLPELRANGRYGLGRSMDVGVSLQGQGTLFAPQKTLTLGTTIDVKREFIRARTGSVEHIFSIALLGAGHVAGRFGLPLTTTLELAAPLFYGVQFEKLEVVLGAAVVDRFVTEPGATGSFHTPRINLTLGVFKRNPAGVAFQIGWLVHPLDVTAGALQVQFGLFFDVVR